MPQDHTFNKYLLSAYYVPDPFSYMCKESIVKYTVGEIMQQYKHIFYLKKNFFFNFYFYLLIYLVAPGLTCGRWAS